MNPERWRRIKELFAEALDRPDQDRADFLEQTCGGDAELRREVDRLLAQAGATLRSPAGGILTPPPDLATGEMLMQYRLEGKLGQGGMGSVYRAFDTRLHRKVALKVLPASRFAGAETRDRLLSEARAASALNHPNIVTVYEVGSGGGVDFIAMECVDGQPLSQLIPPAGLPLPRALVLAAEISGALAQAHAAGVVHRDLKPGNIMVTAAGHIKLLDFGLAQRVFLAGEESVQVQAHGEIAGTPAYMSPEQTDGQRADQRSDVFSFGAVLYEMLTGKRPFSGSSATTVMASVLRDEPPPVKGVPAELAKLVSRCMRKDPARRFQHMGDVRIVLEDVSQELSGRAHPWTHRPTAIAARAALVALLASGAWLTHWAIPRAAAPAAPQSSASLPAALPPPAAPAWPEPARTAPPQILYQVRSPEPEPGPPLWSPFRAAISKMRVVPVAAYSGMVRDPSFSPDGTSIAFSWNGPAAQSIYVRPLTGNATPIRLTMGPDEGATWSPHGTRIAFRRSGGFSPGLYMVPPTGGQEEKIASSAALPDETLPQMSWTPDGNWLAAPEQSGGGSTHIVLHSVHGEGDRQMTWNDAGIDHAPAISPNGAYLAYASCTTVYSCDIYLAGLGRNYAALDRQAARLTHDPAYIRGISWTPDSRSLVYAAGQQADVETHLWRVPIVPPGLPERLDPAGAQVRHPTVSRQGSLAFTRFNYDADIWSYDMAAKTRPWMTGASFDYDPAFSPDGKRVAYCSRASGIDEIWTSNRDGSGKTQLTSELGRGQSAPAWSPDGRSIAFQSLEDDGHSAVYVIAAGGGRPRRVTTPAYDAVAPSWSRDGHEIYFGHRSGSTVDLWRVPAAGGAGVRITDHGGLYSAESPDGKLLYYTKAISPSQMADQTPLYVRSLAGGTERKLIDRIDWYGFTVAVDGIYYISNPSDRTALMFHDFATGHDRALGGISARAFHRITISPDGQTVLFGAVRGLDWSLMLLENFR